MLTVGQPIWLETMRDFENLKSGDTEVPNNATINGEREQFQRLTLLGGIILSQWF